MAESKATLLEDAKALGLDVTAKNTIAEIKAAIAEVTETENVEPTAASVAAEEKVAKAGKRSAKAIAETEEQIAKEERKASGDTDEAKPKKPIKPTRSRLERRGKNYRKAVEGVDLTKVYELKEAIATAVKTSTTKFDASVEVHINLGVDPRHADQNIRDNLVLPAGTGKTIKVAVFADEDVKGADISGVETITKELEKGVISFDTLISTPANMPKLGKYARVLGPRGLMPNPKSGTVTTDVASAVQQAKAGKVEYRVDSTGIVHIAVGKVSFTLEDIEKNIRAVFASVKGNKPATVKGNYVKAVTITSTMGPGIKVAPSEV
jgi:large subunit ribosomal protein L1